LRNFKAARENQFEFKELKIVERFYPAAKKSRMK
jgi:hypothetical protein